jgi:hypothetical protein
MLLEKGLGLFWLRMEDPFPTWVKKKRIVDLLWEDASYNIGD